MLVFFFRFCNSKFVIVLLFNIMSEIMFNKYVLIGLKESGNFVWEGISCLVCFKYRVYDMK